MESKKNKIVFIGLVLTILGFTVTYGWMVLGNEHTENLPLNQPEVPVLQEGQMPYDSRLDAVNDLREDKRNDPPSIYQDALLDSAGFFDPHLREKDRLRIIDSIYREENLEYEPQEVVYDSLPVEPPFPIAENPKFERIDFAEEHADFFSGKLPDHPLHQPEKLKVTDSLIIVAVNGNHKVRQNDRLELRLQKPATVGGMHLPVNTIVYGFVSSLKPNRTMVEITSILHHPVYLKAYDLQDGREGIYIENSISGEVKTEAINQALDEINIPGFPQINGVTGLFKKKTRNISVMIYNQYQLYLKPAL